MVSTLMASQTSFYITTMLLAVLKSALFIDKIFTLCDSTRHGVLLTLVDSIATWLRTTMFLTKSLDFTVSNRAGF
jgi:hypothetical protein